MSDPISFHKVLNNIPNILIPNAQYYILDNNNDISLHIVNNDGTVTAKLRDKTPTILGPSSLINNQSGVFKITNFDSSFEYQITFTDGSLTRDNDIITYTAPNTLGTYGFVINDREVIVNSVSEIISVPVIITPINNDLNVSSAVNITCSLFNSDQINSEHLSTEWQLATDINFTNIVKQDIITSGDLINWDILSLDKNTDYYLRVRYKSIYNYISDWSLTTYFKTKTVFTPSNVIANIFNPRGTPYDGFASSIAISNNLDTIAIGSNNYNGYGAVYIYNQQNNSIEQVNILESSTPINNSQFGYTVSLSGDGLTLVIGAYYETITGINNCGAAYVFEKIAGVWTEVIKLSASDKTANANFGRTVAISKDGNTIAIAAINAASGSFTNVGKIYIFTKVSGVWTQQSIMTGTSLASGMYIGTSLAINENGTIIVAGANGVTISGNSYAGAAFIFKKISGVWNNLARINASDFSSSAYFGNSITVSGDGNTIVVGATNANNPGYNYSGAAYIFKLISGVYTQTNKIASPTPVQYGYFANSCDISNDGNIIIISDNQASVNNFQYVGKVYVYGYISGVLTLLNTLIPEELNYYTMLGRLVCLSYDGSTAVIVANNNDIYGFYSNPSVRIFV